jgi:hypothetical protein
MWVNGDADAKGTVLVRQLRLKMNMGTMNREQLDKLISWSMDARSSWKAGLARYASASYTSSCFEMGSSQRRTFGSTSTSSSVSLSGQTGDVKF